MRKRCPRCGEGRLYRGWYALADTCTECALEFDDGQGNTWAFMYTSTGAITGIIIVGMFLLSPTAIWAGRVAVFGLAAVIIVGTLPYRKGIAIAIDVLVTNKWASPTASDDSNLPDNTIHH